MKKMSPYHKRITPVRYASLALIAVVSTLNAANVDSIWNTGDGDWSHAAHWTNGLPGNPGAGNVSRVLFELVSGQPNAVKINVDTSSTFGYMGTSQGKSVTLEMGAGTVLENTGTLLVGRVAIGATGASSLTVKGPDTGNATFAVGSLQLGGKADASGDSITFSGENLQVTGGTLTLGRQGNQHSMSFESGVKSAFTSVLVSATADAAVSGIGNHNKLSVTGAGTEMTIRATSINGLNAGPRSLTNQSNINAPTGNTIEISDGGTIRVIGESSTTVSHVFVGGTIYRNNNSIQVSGENSLLEVSGNTAITIGGASDTSYHNFMSVRQGGTIRTDVATTISNGTSTAANRRNILEIGAGGSYLSGQSIHNNGGLVRLEEGGILKGETVSQQEQAISLNINGTGRFEASGSGLANNVTVQIGNGTGTATLAMGSANRTEAGTLTLSSTLQMNSNSLLEIAIFGSNEMDSIELLGGSSFQLGTDVTLSLSLSGYTLKAGDSYQLFTGETANVIGNFSNFVLPTLDDGLSYDWTDFNAAGNWQFAVIPEPSSVVLLVGSGLLLLGAGRRSFLRRR